MKTLSVASSTLLLLGPVAGAQPQTAEENNSARISLSFDATVASAYYFRGIIQEDQGAIFQPSAELAFSIDEWEDGSLGAYIGTWSSFHDEKTGASNTDDFVASWYETDFYAGVSLSTARLTTDLIFTSYASPNGAFGTVNEFALSLVLDDSGLWGESDVAIAPYLLIAFEFGDDGADGGANSGVFLALGIEPETTIENTAIGDISLSFPVELGVSIDDYYEVAGSDESFGYVTAGIAASIPIEFMPDGFGSWEFHAGLDVLLLGDHTETINNNDDTEWIAHAGVSVEF